MDAETIRPAATVILTRRAGAGHQVLIESKAGLGIGAEDAHYAALGAEIVATPEEIFARAAMIVKVKEPQAKERGWLR